MHSFASYKFIDLSHDLNENIPVWPDSIRFERFVVKDYSSGCHACSFQFMQGIGTHVDAPAHFIPGGKTITDFNLSNFISDICVIDVRDKVDGNNDYAVSVDDILTYERKYSLIPDGAIVAILTGWSKYWGNEKEYCNYDRDGFMHFPGVSQESAELLVKRNVNGVGIDTLSIDPPIIKNFYAHKLILGAGKYQIENMNNLEKLPPRGGLIAVLPLKISEASESPARIIGLIKD